MADKPSRREREEALIDQACLYDVGRCSDVEEDVMKLGHALHVAHSREDAIRAELNTMGHQPSGLILQNIERILDGDEGAA